MGHATATRWGFEEFSEVWSNTPCALARYSSAQNRAEDHAFGRACLYVPVWIALAVPEGGALL